MEWVIETTLFLWRASHQPVAVIESLYTSWTSPGHCQLIFFSIFLLCFLVSTAWLKFKGIVPSPSGFSKTGQTQLHEPENDLNLHQQFSKYCIISCQLGLDKNIPHTTTGYIFIIVVLFLIFERRGWDTVDGKLFLVSCKRAMEDMISENNLKLTQDLIHL